MKEYFTFADERRWSTPRLEHHFTELQEHQSQPYLSEARKGQVTREMCHVAFEGLMRQRETNQRQQEIEELEYKYSTFTSQQNQPQRKPTKWRKQGT